jgi:hypothetical protein
MRMKEYQKPFEFYFSNMSEEGVELEEVECYPGDFYEKSENDEHPWFEELYDPIIRPYVDKALAFMAPLFTDKRYDPIWISVSPTGIGQSLGGYSSYKNAKGEFYHSFLLHGILLFDYFRIYFEEKKAINPSFEGFWEHEFIHLLDCHREDDPIDHSTYSKELTDYLLKFRSEGLAEFITFYTGDAKHHSFHEAQIDLLNHFEKDVFTQKNRLENRSIEHIMFFSDSRIQYDAGPWILLEILKNKHPESVQPLIEKISNLKKITPEEFYLLVELGLKVSNQDFLNELEKTAYFFSAERVSDFFYQDAVSC